MSRKKGMIEVKDVKLNCMRLFFVFFLVFFGFFWLSFNIIILCPKGFRSNYCIQFDGSAVGSDFS